jgi:hypothetical protein
VTRALEEVATHIGRHLASLSLPPVCGTCWFAPKICSNVPIAYAIGARSLRGQNLNLVESVFGPMPGKR